MLTCVSSCYAAATTATTTTTAPPWQFFLAAGAAEATADSALSTASNSESITYDSIGPTPVVARVSAAIVNTSPIQYSVDFGEAIGSFANGDPTVTVSDLSASASVAGITASGNIYTVTVGVTSTVVVDVRLEVAPSTVQDTAGNDNAQSNVVVITFGEPFGCLHSADQQCYVTFPPSSSRSSCCFFVRLMAMLVPRPTQIPLTQVARCLLMSRLLRTLVPWGTR